MYKHICPNCGRASWSSSEPELLNEQACCPYCGGKLTAGNDKKKATTDNNEIKVSKGE